MNKSKLIRWSVPIAVLVLFWVIPTPEGLTPAAWHMFAIFAATIAGILAAPVASGALMFIALAITYFTNTLPLNDVLKGFASGTVWMIFSAYVLSLGFVQSGLGRRIAYSVLSLSACSLSFQAACSGGRRLVSTDHSLLAFGYATGCCGKHSTIRRRFSIRQNGDTP